jgi:predicted nucleotidyltransferase
MRIMRNHILKSIIEEFKKELSTLYKERLKQLILYGSWARAEASDKSDIDLVVILKGRVIPGLEIDRMIDIITNLNFKHGVLLSVYPVSEDDYLSIKSPLLLNIHKEGVPV